MLRRPYFGVALTSHDTGVLATATFEEVTVIDYQEYLFVDVGNPLLAGNTTVNDAGTFTLRGSGSGGPHQQMHFAYQELVGDGEIQAEYVSSNAVTHSGMNTGVIIRSSLSESSYPNISMEHSILLFGGMVMSYRSYDDSALLDQEIEYGDDGRRSKAAWNYPFSASYRFLRLVRSGDMITGYGSDNGTGWAEWMHSEVPMSAKVYIGLFVRSSEAVPGLAESVFRNVKIIRP